MADAAGAVSGAASGAAQGAAVAGPWGAVAGAAIGGLSSLLGGGGLSKSEKRQNRAIRSLAAQAMPRNYSITTTGGASAGFSQTEGDVTRDAQGNAVPGIKAQDGRELVVAPNGRLRYKDSGKKYDGSKVITQDGSAIRLSDSGKYSGEFSLSQTGFQSEFKTDAGDLTPLRSAFLQGAGQSLQGGFQNIDVGQLGGEAEIANALQAAGIPQEQIEGLMQNAAQARGAGEQFLAKTGEDPLGGLFSAFEGATQASLDELAGGFAGQEQKRLDLLRERAAPQEERQFNALQNRLFAQGRLGTTGGARALEAFATAANQADLDRQLAAQDLGLKGVESARSVASTTGAIANQVAGTRNALDINNLTAALQAFGQAGALEGQAFNQQVTRGDRLRDLGADRFARAADVLTALQGERDTQFSRGAASLGAVQNIDQGLLDLFRTAAVGEQGRQAGVTGAAGILGGTTTGQRSDTVGAATQGFLDAGGGQAVGNKLEQVTRGLFGG